MSRVISDLRTHARAGLLAKLADRFRGHGDLPEMHGAPVPTGERGADGTPLVRDGLGVRPATAGEICAMREQTAVMDLQHDDDLDVADAVKALLAKDGPEWDYAAAAAMKPKQPWDTAEQPVQVPVSDEAAWHHGHRTLTDPRTPDGRPFAPGLLFTPARMTPVTASVEADLDALVWFRESVHREIVRRERPRTDGEGNWLAGYARLWHQRAAATQRAAVAPEPDFGLHRYDGMVDELVRQARVTADAAWVSEKAALAAMATCPEYAGRHSTGEGAAA
jgi:hypothetical protein